MKKNILLFVIALCMATVAMAQSGKSFNSSQLSLRNGITQFLRNEGFQPTLDDEGDIKFKYQGDVYFVIISESATSPMYIELQKYYSYNDNLNRSKIIVAATEINKYHMLKIHPSDNAFYFSCDLYLTSSTTFTSIFYQLMHIIDSAEKEISNL